MLSHLAQFNSKGVIFTRTRVGKASEELCMKVTLQKNGVVLSSLSPSTAAPAETATTAAQQVSHLRSICG